MQAGWIVPILNLLGMGAGSPSGSPPVADFSATPLSGTSPLSVTFTDTSTGSPTSWLWDFDDGDTSVLQNPSHTYLSAGTYSPSLTASNSFGSDTLTRTNYITVSPPPPPPIPSELVCGTALVIAAVTGTAMVLPALIVEGDAAVIARVSGAALVPEC